MDIGRPLSASQLNIWIAQEIDPHNPIYNVADWIEIDGPVDPLVFQEALRLMSLELEASKTRFIRTAAGPRQVLDSSIEPLVSLIDLRSDENPRTAAEAWMKSDLSAPVDLLRGPLVKFALFRAGPERLFWYQRFHKIVMEGFGASFVAQRGAELYAALQASAPNEPFRSSTLTVHLKDDSTYRASRRFARDRHYWLERLASRPDPITLSNNRSPFNSGYRLPNHFLRCTAVLSTSSSEQLELVGRGDEACLPRIIAALAAAYLHRLTSANDLLIGLSVTRHLGAAFRRIRGPVANQLPLRLTITSRTSLSALVEQVGAELRNGLRHQRFAVEESLRDLGLSGSNGQPLFGTAVNVGAFDHHFSIAGHPATVHRLSNGPVEDLSISLYDRAGGRGLQIDFDANPTLYSAEELAGHHQRFLRLVKAAIAEPDRPIGQLDILNPEERHQLLVDWNSTEQPVAKATLPGMFEARVARSPQDPALVFEEITLSYAELNARANRLAHYLISQGVGPETVVAIALPRSIEMVVSLLAILKAGGAYLPLDPDYPQERLANMLQDARPACVLTIIGIAELLPRQVAQFLFDHPDTETRLSQQQAVNPTDVQRIQALGPQHPAYVIYTSGSTGTPKGVIVTHGAIVNRMLWMQSTYKLQSDDRVLQKTSSGFDVSVWEFF